MSWKAVVGCIFPCSHCAKDGNPTPTQAQTHHSIGDSIQPNQSNHSNHRTETGGAYNPMLISKGRSRRYEGAEGPRPMLCGPSQAPMQTRSFPSSGRPGFTTGFERRVKAYQDQLNRQEWYHQQPHGPWVNAPHPWYYTQPDPSFWLSKQPSCSTTLQGYSHPLSHQQELYGCSQPVSQQQELQHYSSLFQQRQVKQNIPELRLRTQKMDNNSQTMEEESNSFPGEAEATTSRRSAPSAPAPGDQPEHGYTEEPSVK